MALERGTSAGVVGRNAKAERELGRTHANSIVLPGVRWNAN